MGTNQTYKICTANETLNKPKDNPWTGKKYLQIM